MKGTEIFVIPRRGVNFGFWSYLGCSGQNAIIFSREVPKMQLANTVEPRGRLREFGPYWVKLCLISIC